jgi:hypothetical protein
MLFLDGDPAIPEETVQSTVSLTVTLAWAAAALVAAYLVVTIVSAIIHRIARRRPLLRDMSVRLRRPLRVLLMVVAVWIAFRLSAHQDEAWYDPLRHGLLIATILASAWLVGAMAFVVEDRTLARISHSSDDRHARRVQTQISVVRRVTVAVIAVLAVGAVLLTFPAMRAAGASILASAGLLSLVAGLAAQSSLANTFAGMQIAFTDAIRVDDVVVLNGEFGRIEEITLTYVVVHAWDDRRLILPSTYFTTTPFENWTRRAADLLGTVEIDVDFRVPLDDMRAELDRLLAESSLWDQRLGILQVTGATEGVVRTRALVSAADAGNLWDLRCAVREGLVVWLQRAAPYAIPRTRLQGVAPLPDDDGDGPAISPVEDSAASAGASADPAPSERIGRRAPAVLPAAPGSSAASTGSATDSAAESAAEAPAGGTRSTTRRGPRRAPVRDRRLPSPTRSSVPPAETPETTVLLGDVPVTARGGAAETVVMSPIDRPGLYSGSKDAEERAQHFSGPGEDAIAEREELAERRLTGEVATEVFRDDDGEGDVGDTDGTGRRPRRMAPDSGDGGPTDGPGEGHDGGDGQ